MGLTSHGLRFFLKHGMPEKIGRSIDLMIIARIHSFGVDYV
jgi:hypothetical protein